MKTRGEVSPAAQHFEYENLKKVRECSSRVGNRRIPKYTRCIDIFRASFDTQQYSQYKFCV